MRRVGFLLTALTIVIAVAAPLYAVPDEQKSMRAVAALARYAIGSHCVDPEGTWTLAPPPPEYFDGGSPNQKMLVRVWHYGWALRQPTRPSNMGTIRNDLLDFINRQQQTTGASGGPLGHYATSTNANEELTSSHYQLWAASLAAAYLYAIANGQRFTSSSQDGSTPENLVRDAVRKWWSDEYDLYRRIYVTTGNGTLDAPGGRFASTHPTMGPLLTNALRDDVHRLLQGLPPLEQSNCSSHRVYTASFVMQTLLAKGVAKLSVPPGTHVPKAKLYDTLCVYRMGSDWTLYFPQMRGVGGALYWTEFRNGVIKRATVPFNGVKPQAYPFGQATKDEIKGVALAGSETCKEPHLINQ